MTFLRRSVINVCQIRRLKDELSLGGDEYSSSSCGPAQTPTSFEGMQGLRVPRLSLLDSGPYLSREEILAMLPERKVVDRHVSHFFNAFDMACCKC